jgi:hypothetical protein
MTAWPKTEFVFLRWTVAAMVVLCAWFAFVGVREAIAGSAIAGLLGLIFWLTTAVGLYGLMQWGRWLALAVLWLLVLFTLSPFGEMSTLAMIKGEAPPLPIWHELIRYIAPFGITSLFFIEVLYAYKNEFKFSRRTQVAGDLVASQPAPPRSWIFWSLAVVAAPTLIVFLSTWDIQLAGGCIKLYDPHDAAAHPSTFRVIPVLFAIVLGSLIFLRAAPTNASRRHLIGRVLVYATIMLMFYGGIRNYLWYNNHCYP